MGKNASCIVKLIQEKKTYRNEKGLLGEVSCTFPQCQTKRKWAAKRINRFYQTYRRHILHDAKFRLQKEVQKTQEQESFLPFKVGAVSETSCNNGHFLSVICDRSEKKAQEPETIFRRCDIWDLNTGLPVLWEDLFARKPLKRHKILPILYKMAGRHEQIEQSDEIATQRSLRLHFQKEQYYLTPDNLVFYYQPGTIAPPERGVVLFPIPLETLGICLPSSQGSTMPRLRSLRFLPE